MSYFLEHHADMEDPYAGYLATTDFDHETQFEDFGEEFGGAVDAFEGVEVSCLDQTGADWATLMMTASLGGAAIHGFSFASSIESVVKVSHEYSAKHAVGRIKYQSNDKLVEHLDEDWDLTDCTGTLFKSTYTSTDASIMVDQTNWDGQNKTRAKNTAILAGIVHATGGTMADAQLLASACAGEEVPEEVVRAASVPMTASKREIVGVAKQSHAVYSRGNAQKKIVWEDQNLSRSALPPNGAMDWGRLTALARTIGEINIRYDPDFRAIAEHIGVPFAIVKGAWAYTSPTDYIIHKDALARVYMPRNVNLLVPTLRNAFETVSEDIYAEMSRKANSYHDEPATKNAFFEAMAAITDNMRPKRTRNVIVPGTNVLSEVTEHKYGAEIAANMISDSLTARNTVIESYRKIILTNRAFTQAAATVSSVLPGEDIPRKEVYFLMDIFCDRVLWADALSSYVEKSGNIQAARVRLGRYKNTFFKSGVELDAKVGKTAVIQKKIFDEVRSATKTAMLDIGPVCKKPLDLTPITRQPTRLLITQLMDAAKNHLTKYKLAWAERYRKRATMAAISTIVDHEERAVHYGNCASAFSRLAVNDLASSGSGFVDVSLPYKTYIWESASNYARKRKLELPPRVMPGMSHIRDIATALDAMYHPPISFLSSVEFTLTRVEMFVADFSMGHVDEVNEPGDLDNHADDEMLSDIKRSQTNATDIIHDGVEDDVSECSVEVITEENSEEVGDRASASYVNKYALPDTMNLNSTEEEEYDEEFLRMMEEMNAPIVRVTRESVLSTYDTLEMAERIAKHNNYATFDDAYDALGEGARYDIETEFTSSALEKIALEDKVDALKDNFDVLM